MEIARFAASQLFFKWGGFETIPVEGSISYQDLAAATKSEEALLSEYRKTRGLSLRWTVD